MADGERPLSLSERLDPGPEGGLPAGPYGDLRRATARWAADGAEAAGAFGEALLDLDGPLGRSFALDQPNVAGMGVGAWGLMVSDPGGLAAPEHGLKRMIGGGLLGGLLEDDEAPAEAEDDPDALARGADLLEALQRLDAAGAQLSESAPEGLRDQVAALRLDLRRRLTRERRLAPGLDAALREVDRADPTAPDALRARATPAEPDIPDAVPARPSAAALEDPYRASVDVALAREPAPTDDAALEALRARIAETTAAALRHAPDSAAGRAAVERARRLLAEEVARSGGRVDPTTAAARAALADRATRTPRPAAASGVAPAAGLPEVPIWSSRGDARQVVGYLRADERTDALDRTDAHVRVPVPGRKAPGWIDAAHVREASAAVAAAGRAPGALSRALRQVAGGLPSADLARLAALVARETGRPISALLAEASEKPEVAKAPRRARGAAGPAAPSVPAGAPITIGKVDVTGLESRHGARAAALLNAALAQLPDVLEGRLSDPSRRALLTRRLGRLPVDLDLDVADGDVRARGRVIADRIADALLSARAARVESLDLGLQLRASDEGTPTQLLGALQAGDPETVGEALRGEGRTLDGTVRGRLANFFGHDFGQARVFAGPMAGALARAVAAEAFTHGQMVFFDPKHFRPDTARGEALLAHELTHTGQADDRDARLKEAEAIAAERAYLGWLQGDGAPFAAELDDPLDVTAPEAAQAADVASLGALRAREGRSRSGNEGPRKDTEQHEERVAQVLDRVQEMLVAQGLSEEERIGVLKRIFSGPI